MDDTWSTRDLPVLDAAVQMLEDDLGHMPTLRELATQVSMEVQQVGRAAAALDGKYLELQRLTTGGDVGPWFVTSVTPLARTAIGQWPSGEAWTERIVDAINRAADNEQDPDKQSRLRSTATALGGIARDVTVAALSAGIIGAAGL